MGDFSWIPENPLPQGSPPRPIRVRHRTPAPLLQPKPRAGAPDPRQTSPPCTTGPPIPAPTALAQPARAPLDPVPEGHRRPPQSPGSMARGMHRGTKCHRRPLRKPCKHDLRSRPRFIDTRRNPREIIGNRSLAVLPRHPVRHDPIGPPLIEPVQRLNRNLQPTLTAPDRTQPFHHRLGVFTVPMESNQNPSRLRLRRIHQVSSMNPRRQNPLYHGSILRIERNRSLNADVQSGRGRDP